MWCIQVYLVRTQMCIKYQSVSERICGWWHVCSKFPPKLVQILYKSSQTSESRLKSTCLMAPKVAIERSLECTPSTYGPHVPRSAATAGNINQPRPAHKRPHPLLNHLVEVVVAWRVCDVVTWRWVLDFWGAFSLLRWYSATLTW